MILVTHNIDEAFRMCDKILVLSNGQQIFFGNKNDFFLKSNEYRNS